MNTFSFSAIMEKMSSRDKDFRYMALSDLASELETTEMAMYANEQRLTSTVLSLLKDQSNNIQELAVKCLGPLVRKVKDNTVLDMADVLTDSMLTTDKNNEELRDISCMGLKTVIAAVPLGDNTNSGGPLLASNLHKRLSTRLISGISKHTLPEVRVYCLEILNELLTRFGKSMPHEPILNAVLPQLTSNQSLLRKRAITCIGHLSVVVPESLFKQLVENLCDGVSKVTKSEYIRAFIQSITSIGSTVGFRLGKFLHNIVPLIISFCDKEEQDDELRENCFQAFETLLLRCPQDMASWVSQVVDLCLKYIKYDPNYAADDDGVEDMETDMDEDEDEMSEEEDVDYSDDDDMSWKVRRSSTKALGSVITTRPDLLSDIYERVAPALISRFKEREENVKMDVFKTFIDLLKQTEVATRCSPQQLKITQQQLQSLIPRIMSGIPKQLVKEKSLKTRARLFALLKALVLTVTPADNSSFLPHIGSLVPGIAHSLGTKNTDANLKVEALIFLRLLLSTQPADIFIPHLDSLSPPVFSAVTDSYYRIAAEGLRVASEMAAVFKEAALHNNQPNLVKDLYSACFTQLKAQDIDQEVKEAALQCMGTIIYTVGNMLKNELHTCLSLLLDRLRNEITRLSAVKVLAHVAESPLNIDLTTILSESLRELAGFLRKSNRQLRQSALHTLSTLIVHYRSLPIAQELFPLILAELSSLITDTDLYLSYLAVQLIVQILRVPHSEESQKSHSLVQKRILPQALDLAKSSLLQGLALRSLIELFGTLLHLQSPELDFNALLGHLLDLTTNNSKGEPLSKQAYSSIAQCVAALCLSAVPSQSDATVSKFIHDITSHDDAVQLTALLCIGEIGKKVDLSSHTDLAEVLLASFESSLEEVKQAASFALGNITVGCMGKYLPFVLKEINAQPQRQYLLLHSLREIILRQSTVEGVQLLKPYLGEILKLLFAHCDSPEEGTRNVVAECLGKLTMISPNELISELDKRSKSQSAFERATVVAAIKYAVVEQPNENVETLLGERMSNFLSLLSDTEPHVRRAVMLTLNYTAHHKPRLISELVTVFLPALYNETQIRPELIREVDLGPFKHKVDDGLELRKAAYECLHTLLGPSESSAIPLLAGVDVRPLIRTIAKGMSDHNDIRLLTHHMIIRLAQYSSMALLEGLDTLVEPLRETITSKPKDTAVKQEVERHEELVRSALRAIACVVSKVPQVESVPAFRDFVRSSDFPSTLFGEVQKERENGVILD